jgi:hypothetical protein
VLSALQKGEIGDAEYHESIEDRIASVSKHVLKVRPSLGYRAHLIIVPPGEELLHITLIQGRYHRQLASLVAGMGTKIDLFGLGGFNVQLNHILSIAERRRWWWRGKGIQASTFQFSPKHTEYLQMIGLPCRSPARGPGNEVRILILDSGLASDCGFPVLGRLNFVDHLEPDAPDDNGHGTVIAKIVHSVSPDAKILVYKVADAEGRISEWDALAALAADSGAHVINMSLAFGLENRPQRILCRMCGRESHQSRSKVFEAIIKSVTLTGSKPIVVAAAGNVNADSAQRDELAFPARFGAVAAIGSINASGELSSFSRYGDRDQRGRKHERRFVLPGGDAAEGIGAFAGKEPQYGTSMAAAYGSGFVAHLLAHYGIETLSTGEIWNLLRQQAKDHKLRGYESIKHGFGLLTWFDRAGTPLGLVGEPGVELDKKDFHVNPKPAKIQGEEIREAKVNRGPKAPGAREEIHAAKVNRGPKAPGANDK